MNIPQDIALFIFHSLPISDKRNLIRTCNEYHKLTHLMKQIEKDFIKMIDIVNHNYFLMLNTYCFLVSFPQRVKILKQTFLFWLNYSNVFVNWNLGFRTKRVFCNEINIDVNGSIRGVVGRSTRNIF